MLNFPLIGAFAPQVPTTKRDWRASLFDRLNPDDTLGLTDSDKSKLGRQALLGLASGLLGTGGGFSNALSSGLQTGLLAMNQGADDVVNRRYKQQLVANQTAVPSEFRSADMIARAAGFEPGTPEYQNFMRVQGGVVGRASNAGLQTDTVDINGVPTRVIFDPRTGRNRVATLDGVGAPDGLPAPLSAGMEQQPGGDLLDIQSLQQDFRTAFPEIGITSGFRSPEKNAAVDGVPNSFHLTGEAFDVATRTPQEAQEAMVWGQQNGLQAINEGDHVHFEPRARGMTTNRLSAQVPIVGRTKEAEAAAIKSAEENARLGAYIANAGTVGQIDASNAALKAGAEASAKAGVDRASAAVDKANALRVYETAVSGLQTALGGTTTGPVVGRLPAVTTGAQTAEGAQAAMAPVLKQLFRTAGEGTFSDSDQKLLISMLPTRMDTPQAAKNKMQNIDAIVRAKLGQTATASPDASRPSDADARRKALLDKY